MVDNWRVIFGARLRQARLDVPLTQIELAALLGVEQTTISRWERGGTAPPDELRPRLAAHLGCPVHELFAYDDNGEAVA
jgi:transcriptional regulator with XRE-family HTH domain